MSLSRLPQVALRRLVPALAAVPKSLDDDQLKKILDPQQQQQLQQQLQQLGGSPAGKGALSAKSEFANITSATQGVIAALAKSGAASTSPVLSRLLTNLSGSQGNLSLQELALLRAASSTTGSDSSSSLLLASSDVSPLLTATPEPASPDSGPGMIDYEPTAAADALDAASIDLLASALQGTAAITPASSSSSFSPGRRRSSAGAANKTEPQHASAAAATLEEHDSLVEAESDSDTMPTNFAELSASERRKEQNRRAQKKFRQKDKVRQKEIKWRASQYEDLVASNKRFKHDIDAVTRERDMYRQILERNGISLSEDDSTAAATKPAQALLASKPDVLPRASGLSLPSAVVTAGAAPAIASASPLRTPSLASSAAGTASSPMLLSAEPHPSLSEMEQIAQDTFGSLPAVPTIVGPSSLPLLSLLGGGSGHFGVGGSGAVKADPMFGVCGIPLAAQTSQASAAFLDHSSVAASVSTTGSSLGAPQMAGTTGNTSRLLGSTGAVAMPDGVDFDSTLSALASAIQGTAASSAAPVPSTTAAAAAAAASNSSSLWFGVNGIGSSSSSDPLLIESPLIVDQHSIDQSTIDGQFVDPVSFIDELLSSPDYSPSMQQAPLAHSGAISFSRKRSFDEAMFR
ncbi:hypothetical protein IWW48_005465 [Coemansia sp. RSA 1200]|nr:hypothetical protein IWW48_005465 [Coemansia sp. RSA 1200]